MKRYRKQTDLLVDGDILLHRFGHSNHTKIDWGEDCVTNEYDTDKAKKELDDFIKWMRSYTRTLRVTVCLSGEFNFRYGVLPTYKHNRDDDKKPKIIEDLKQHIRDTWDTEEHNLLEADDVLGIMASAEPEKYLLATLDKDLLQIPCRHFNWNKRKYTDVDTYDGDYMFFIQVLTGDITDGYKGAPKIGKVKAAKILEDYFDEESRTRSAGVWSAILEAYAQEQNLCISWESLHETALAQARVARMLRHNEHRKWKPILWKPSDFELGTEGV
jgi:DNA polymerase-1